MDQIADDILEAEDKDVSEEAKALLPHIAGLITIQSSFTAAGEERNIAVVMQGRSSIGEHSSNLCAHSMDPMAMIA